VPNKLRKKKTNLGRGQKCVINKMTRGSTGGDRAFTHTHWIEDLRRKKPYQQKGVPRPKDTQVVAKKRNKKRVSYLGRRDESDSGTSCRGKCRRAKERKKDRKFRAVVEGRITMS